jgi:hypothetical protein
VQPERGKWQASTMSSWSSAGDWLTAAGSSLLVLGTWTQAWASLTEYRDLFKDLPQAARAALEASMASRITILRSPRVAIVTPSHPRGHHHRDPAPA